MRIILGLIALAVLALGLYVRFAPSVSSDWHIAPEVRAPGDYSGERSFTAVRDGIKPQIMAEVARVALSTPRTTLLAGSSEAGRMTFVTRSKLWGFPDYTTVDLTGDRLTIWGRSRFGRRDLGVNQARVTDWLIRLGLAAS